MRAVGAFLNLPQPFFQFLNDELFVGVGQTFLHVFALDDDDDAGAEGVQLGLLIRGLFGRGVRISGSVHNRRFVGWKGFTERLLSQHAGAVFGQEGEFAVFGHLLQGRSGSDHDH